MNRFRVPSTVRRATANQLGFILIGATIMFACYFVIYIVGIVGFGDVSEQYHGKAAEAYFSRSVRPYFKLPQEAVLEEVHTMGDFYPELESVTFRLPKSKAPRQWLREIWQANRLPEKLWMPKEEEYRIEWVNRKPVASYEVISDSKWGGRRLHHSNGRYLLQVHGLYLASD